MRLAVLVLAALVACDALSFEKYVIQFHKTYATEAERALRETYFNRNVEVISRLQAAHAGQNVTFGVNKFTDRSPQEMQAMKLVPDAGVEFPADRFAPAATGVSLPPAWDWTAHGAVTTVKDQGTVGSCWAFSTVGNIEGQVFLKNKVLASLSAEYLVDCDYIDCSVFGGWPYNAYKFIEESGGIPTDAAYPYCSGTGGCYPCMLNKNYTYCGPPPEYCNKTIEQQCKGFVPAAKLSSWVAISKNETDIAAQLLSRGPLSVCMDASWLDAYTGGIWDPSGLFNCDSSGQNLDHAILIVGYGTENNVPYWKVKNSWGADWGEAGYFRIIRGIGKCGINSQVTSALLA